VFLTQTVSLKKEKVPVLLTDVCLPGNPVTETASNAATMNALKCPLCGGALLRMPRRPVDRLASLVRPVCRYRCMAVHCQWEGNLRRPLNRREPASSPAIKQYHGPERRRHQS